jgi:WD40 repeat protein
MKHKMYLIAAVMLIIAYANLFSQPVPDDLPDTVWTKFTYPNAINAVKFTPEGKYLASGGDDGIPRLWDSETGELVREFSGNGWPILGLDVNPNGELLAVVNKISVITIWNVNTGEIVKKLDEYPNQTQGLEYKSIDFSNNGLYLAASIANKTNSGIEPSVFIWSTNTWEILGKLENMINLFHITFSPDDSLLAVSNIVDGPERKTVGLYQVPSLKRIGGTEYIKTTIKQTTFSPDGKYLAAAMSDSPNKVWNTSDWKLEKEFGDNSYSICYSNDNQFIVTGGGQPTNRHVYIRNAKTYDLIYTYPKSNVPTSVDVSPNNKYIAASLMTSGIIVYNAKWNHTSVEDNPIKITEPMIFPNPTNQTANIRFNLLKPSQINISIFDINSKMISNIYDGFLAQGMQTFSWNVSGVLSGTYFAQITANGNKSSIKIIVNK